MAKIFVIQTGQTSWEAQERFESVAGTPLTVDGENHVQASLEELSEQGIDSLYAADGEPERQTAELLSRSINVRIREIPQLREMDFGLWQGLTGDEVKRRQPRMYRLWTESPDSVRPPGGETLAEAQQRVSNALRQILKRNKSQTMLLVLRPMVSGLLRCRISSEERNSIWKVLGSGFTWGSYEMGSDAL